MRANSSLIGFWWAAWLICNLISNAAMRMQWSARSLEEDRAAAAVGIAADATTAVAAVLALLVVGAIEQRQMARAQQLGLLDDVDVDSRASRDE